MKTSRRMVREGVSWTYLFHTCAAISCGDDLVDREAEEIGLLVGGVEIEAEDCLGAGVGVLVTGELFAGVD